MCLKIIHFFSFLLLWSAVAVHNSEKRIKIPVKSKFLKGTNFECTKFMYLDLITDMPNIDSKISQPIHHKEA